MNKTLAWAILVALVTSALYVGGRMNSLDTVAGQVKDQEVRIRLLEVNGSVTATKLSTIEEGVRDIQLRLGAREIERE